MNDGLERDEQPGEEWGHEPGENQDEEPEDSLNGGRALNGEAGEERAGDRAEELGGKLAEERAEELADRRRFKTYGRKKGHLNPREARWLDEILPKLELRPAPDRAALLGQWGPGQDEGALWLEVGFGNGDFLAETARRHPGDALIGVDIFLEGFSGLIRKLEKNGSVNVRLIRDHAHPGIRDRIPDSSLDRVIINFPDPWPKKRHHKRRLIQTPFLDLLAAKMRPGALMTLATDWAEYAEWMVEFIGPHPVFEGGPVPEATDWIPTRFQTKGVKAGRPTTHLAYRRRG